MINSSMGKFFDAITKIELITENPDVVSVDDHEKYYAIDHDDESITFVGTKYGSVWGDTNDGRLIHYDLGLVLQGIGDEVQGSWYTSIFKNDLESIHEDDPDIQELVENERVSPNTISGRYFSEPKIMSFWNPLEKLQEHKELVDNLLVDMGLWGIKDKIRFEPVIPEFLVSYDELFKAEAESEDPDKVKELQSIQHLIPQAKKALRDNPDVFKTTKEKDSFKDYYNSEVR